jgi:hypothetical protein
MGFLIALLMSLFSPALERAETEIFDPMEPWIEEYFPSEEEGAVPTP